jgi:hypothetical protein
MKRRQTPKAIDALPPAVNKRSEVHDQLLPGLHLRVLGTGGKVFHISRRINGRARCKAECNPEHFARECAQQKTRLAANEENLVAEEGFEPPTRGL